MSLQTVEKLTPEEFRRKIAGLENQTKIKEADRQNLRDEAVRFSTILARLFSDDLDRMTLWERIGSALVVSVAKCGGDIDAFVNHALAHIHASPASVAASEEILQVIETYGTRPSDWKAEYLSYISRHHYIILVHARARWNEVKSRRKEL